MGARKKRKAVKVKIEPVEQDIDPAPAKKPPKKPAWWSKDTATDPIKWPLRKP